jgi:hypothetical protein
MGIVEDIRDQFTGLNPFEIKDNVRILVIGLGGAGGKYAAETKRLLTQRHGEQAIRDKMDFYCIDTTIDDFDPIMTEAERQKISGFTINDWVEEWINPDLRERIQKGVLGPNAQASGIRQSGRIMLFSSATPIIQHFDSIIRRYAEGNPSYIYVVVLSSICGGTGCGTFLDIPYFVRQSARNVQFSESVFHFYGMFELPDSKIKTDNPNPDREAEFYSNAYAALQDLEYFMHDDVVYKARISGANFESDKRAFEQCYLISHDATNMETFARFSRDKAYLNRAIPEAINLMICKILTPEQEAQEVGQPRFFDFRSGHDNALARWPKQNQTGRLCYGATFGVSKIEIPMAEIITAIFNRIFDCLQSRWDTMKDNLELQIKVIENEIIPSFRIQELYALASSIDVSDIPINTDTVNILNRYFIGLAVDNECVKIETNINEGVEQKKNELYEKYGPFFALKVFEEGMYGKALDHSLQKFATAGVDVAEKINELLNTKWGVFRKKEKSKLEADIRTSLDSYKKTLSYVFIIGVINRIRQSIKKDHAVMFEKTVAMVQEMRKVLSSLTDIKTQATIQRSPEGSIFAWDTNNVSRTDINEKVKYLFVKKITFRKDNKDEFVYTSEAIFLKKKGKKTETRMFFWDKSGGEISIATVVDGENVELDHVTGIEEILQFNCQRGQALSIEDMLRKFLRAIKDDRTTDKEKYEAAVSQIMVEHFSEIIQLFNRAAFQELIILSSGGVKISEPVANMDESKRKALFKKAIVDFNNNALPSFPVADTYRFEANMAENYAVRFQPYFDDLYRRYIDQVKDGPVGGKIQIIDKIPNLAMMLSVNFYFNFDFKSYLFIGKCREAYERKVELGATASAGLHIAEGNVDDIRDKVERL